MSEFLALLRSFIHDTPPEGAETWDIAALSQTALRQNLLPVLAYENKRWQLFAADDVKKQLDTILYGAVTGNLNRCASFEQLSQQLTAHDIAHMPVKGYYLRQLYPVPELRTFGDIDILIHPEDRRKAHQLMMALGYTAGQDWEPTYSYVKGMEHYELHTNLMDGNLDDRADLPAYFQNAWQYAEPDNGLRFRPTLDFHFIYTVCHLAKHLYGGGAGIRMYLDVALYIRHYDGEIDWDTVTGEFSSLHLLDFFHTVMNACRAWFGTETVCPLAEPDSAALDALLDYTLDADLFGHLRDHSVIRLRGTDPQAPSRGRVFLRMLFPPAAEIETRYTFLKGRYWLLPLAWLVRLFANLRLIPQRLRQMRQVSHTETGSVKAYDDFMKRIGL